MLIIEVKKALFGYAVDVIIKKDDAQISCLALSRRNRGGKILDSEHTDKELKEVIAAFENALSELKDFADSGF